jgi:hypothetical protein
VTEPSVCVLTAGTKELMPIAVGSSVGGRPDQRCEEKRRMTRMCPPIPGLWAVYTHRNCTHNEEVALRNRVIGAVPLPSQAGVRHLRQTLPILLRRMPSISPISKEAFCDHYTGRRKTRYLEACKSLQDKALVLPKEALVRAFVKSEKFSPEKVNPDPRMIQARSPRFNVEIGCFLKPIEHHIYRLVDDDGDPYIAKGMPPWARGEAIWKMWNSFHSPVAIILDGRRWDQHIAQEILQLEHDFYLACIDDPWFRELLSTQLFNKVVTAGGWRYKVKGNRMSGDMNTALGNCVIMLLMILTIARKLGIKVKVLDDGDDIVVMIDAKDLDLFMANVGPMFTSFGQEVKVEATAHRMEDIDFCQSRPVRTNTGGYTMLPNWRKIISQSTAGVRYWAEPKTRIDMAYSVGQCLLALYPGMPIVQTYASKLCSMGKFNRSIMDTDWMWKVLPTGKARGLGTLGPEPITMDTRDSFASAYKVDPIDQVAIENAILKWELPVGSHVMGQVVSGEWQWDHCICHDPAGWDTPTHGCAG